MKYVKGIVFCLGLLVFHHSDAQCWGLMRAITYFGGSVFFYDVCKTVGEDPLSVLHLERTVDRFSRFTTVNDILASKKTKKICTRIVNFSTYCGEKLNELIKEGVRNLESTESEPYEQPKE